MGEGLLVLEDAAPTVGWVIDVKVTVHEALSSSAMVPHSRIYRPPAIREDVGQLFCPSQSDKLLRCEIWSGIGLPSIRRRPRRSTGTSRSTNAS